MPERFDHKNADDLASSLADAIIANLNEALAANGRASIAVSGGSTPKKLFATLSARDDLDWSRIDVTLVDERWVDETSDRSNAALLRENLLQNHAASAHFVPLYSGGDLPDANAVAKTNARIATMHMPLDVAVLGMGNDGHTASFFPGGDTLDQALGDPGPVIALNAEGAGEPRVTLTLPVLAASRHLYLHIEGQAKADTLDKALADGPIAEMPVRAVLRHTKAAPVIYWCP